MPGLSATDALSLLLDPTFEALTDGDWDSCVCGICGVCPLFESDDGIRNDCTPLTVGTVNTCCQAKIPLWDNLQRVFNCLKGGVASSQMVLMEE